MKLFNAISAVFLVITMLAACQSQKPGEKSSDEAKAPSSSLDRRQSALLGLDFAF